MSVMNRKLFADRAARNTLRNMGGIMGSYPELIQEVQGYRDGATVSASMPMRRLRNDSFIPTSPQGMGASLAVEELLRDPDVIFAAEQSGLTPAEYLSRLNADQFAAAIENLSTPRAIRDEASFEMQGEPVPSIQPPSLSEEGMTGVPLTEVVGSQDIRRRANEDLRNMPRESVGNVISDVLGTPFVNEIEALGDPAREGMTEEAAGMLLDSFEEAAGIPLPNVLPSEAPEQRRAIEEAAQGEFGGLPPSMTQPAPLVETPQSDAAEAEAEVPDEQQYQPGDIIEQGGNQFQVQEDGSIVPVDQGPTVPDENINVREDLLADAQESSDDLRSKYEDRLKLFQEVLGGVDEQTAQDKAMQLAMIGLAIASGQSPNALTNIAQGALVGLQSMSEQEAARRTQDRELRASALESVLKEANERVGDEESTRNAVMDAYFTIYQERLKGLQNLGGEGGYSAEEMAAEADRAARLAVGRTYGQDALTYLPSLGTE